MASVQLLTAGSGEGGRDPSRFPLLLLLSDTGFAVGDGSHTSNSCLCTAAGMLCLVQVLPRSPRCLPLGTKVSAFLGTISGLPVLQKARPCGRWLGREKRPAVVTF